MDKKECNHILIARQDKTYLVNINDVELHGVQGYKITTSESGKTEIELKICVDTPMTWIDFGILTQKR